MIHLSVVSLRHLLDGNWLTDGKLMELHHCEQVQILSECVDCALDHFFVFIFRRHIQQADSVAVHFAHLGSIDERGTLISQSV